MSELCDNCEMESAEFEVRVQRPSDPTDMVCIAFTCATCSTPLSADTLKQVIPKSPKVPQAATSEAWQEYMESDEAARAGHIWAT